MKWKAHIEKDTAYLNNSYTKDGKIFVTPNLHKIHHHQNQEYTDSNYGNVFIFWDKHFGTYKELPVREIKYGLMEFEDQKKKSAWYLFISPFIYMKRLDK